MKHTSTPVALAPALALAPILVLGLSACTSGDSTASKTNGADESASAFDWDVAFATCMRGAGLDYPDPKPDDAEIAQVPVADEAAFAAAQKICTTETESARGKRPVSAADRKKRDGWNDAYAKTVDCLRKKGHEVELIDGGFTPRGEIPEADMAECSADTPKQQIGGDE